MKNKLQMHIRTPKDSPSPSGDLNKYSDYLVTYHSEPLQQIQPRPFNDIIGDGVFDDVHKINNNRQQHDFEFEDFIPILKEDKEEYDLDAAFHCYEADTGYEGEGDAGPPMLTQPQPMEEDQPLVLRPQTPPDQRRPQVSTLGVPLPEEEVEQPEGAIGREV
jgi:hypothetical protein